MQQGNTQTAVTAGRRAFFRDPATHAVLALGITQIIAWGTTLYALGVLGKPIAADTGWSQSLVFGGLTVGLLTSAAVSPAVGRMLDRRGGRVVMALGSLVMAGGLVLLSLVSDPLATTSAPGLKLSGTRPRYSTSMTAGARGGRLSILKR